MELSHCWLHDWSLYLPLLVLLPLLSAAILSAAGTAHEATECQGRAGKQPCKESYNLRRV